MIINPPKIPATATTITSAAMAPSPSTTTNVVRSITPVPVPVPVPVPAPLATIQPKPRSQTPLSYPPQYQIQQQQQHQSLYSTTQIRKTQNPKPIQQVPNASKTTSQPVLYPVASSGRGYISNPAIRPLPRPENTVTVANPGGYRPLPLNYHPPHPTGAVSPHFDGALNLHHMVRHPHTSQPQNHPQQYLHHVQNAGHSGLIKGVPLSGQQKVTPFPVSDSNGHNKRMRDRSKDDTVIIRDRKVRISDGASLYSLCRSWLKNGVPEENQPQNRGGLKSLPKPLPLAPLDPSPNDKDDTAEVKDIKEGESVDHLSSKDLLQGHIKRAKKFRSKLREERMRRIARYKVRLALLLPPLAEGLKNDTTAGY